MECLLEHEARLRHRAFKSVDQQDTAVGHIEHTLHLAAEIGVSRGVDDIDLRAFVADRDILREDGYTALTFKVIIIEHEVVGLLVLAEEVSGEQHLVHERRLAVVNVGNDCNVTDVLHIIIDIYILFQHAKLLQSARKKLK